ncbi:N-arginine dibasic convertase, putative [Talaromyces stipitatus ATCC 10500]|uniref:N-arginine dibasic convertase, putative n=1 Tax=Talaromyces stipitatus (strain ATCC 10500 / CBS 375.48 / QM 6759 / NRRL 1006) TaxID=441959 RepID=B8MUL9_TALSN|nr:N-arginine dibasic convertase, putative [Talaromyces stipitatus ATCC 10500]EED11687.1 N-arginine dibasic convertase, putative [Talaromyces stipitatus ATCC 10500]
MSTVVTKQLLKPKLDRRQYRVLRLRNGLEVLLVYDLNATQASASLNVGVGRLDDDKDVLGMAHLTQKNGFKTYVAAHSGRSNSFTSATETTFHFQVAATASGNSAPLPQGSPLYGALCRFVKTFTAPLFLESTLDAAVKAIDLQYKTNFREDAHRRLQLQKSLSNPDHPYCRFSLGNLETLRDNPQACSIDVQGKVMEFYKSHYSANRMKLVVLGPNSLNQLEEWVIDLFSRIQNKNVVQKRWDSVPLFSEDQLGMQVFVESVKANYLLYIHFPFLDEEDLYETLPSRYISHLISNKGSGSILSWLTAKGWATDLSAYPKHVCPGSAYYQISVTLTESGCASYKEIIKVIFQYIGIIKERPPQEWVFNEVKNLTQNRFQFGPEEHPAKFTNRLSSVMQTPIPRGSLLSHFVPIKFDAALITRALTYLHCDKFRLMLFSRPFAGDYDSEEKWYQTKYKVEEIRQDFR